MTRHTSLIAGAFIALAAPSWLAATQPAQADGPVLNTPPVPYTWQISADDQARLYERVKMLRYGDSLMRVTALLGPPTLEQDSANKRGDKRAHQLTYAIRRVRPEGGNMYDQEINLIFGDQSHCLLEIWFTNMAPLSGDITYIVKIPGTMETHSTFTKPPAQ